MAPGVANSNHEIDVVKNGNIKQKQKRQEILTPKLILCE